MVLEALRQGIAKAFPDRELSEFVIRLEYASNESFGDYSSSFALENKKHLSGNPIEIANKIYPLIPNGLFQEVTVTPPGFINFRMKQSFMKKYIFSTFGIHDNYAKAEVSKKIMVEFVSANPTGPMNIVSARSAALGDGMVGLLKTRGHDVHKEFYVNDYGNQVRLLGVSLLCRIQEQMGRDIRFEESEDTQISLEVAIESNTIPQGGYRGEYLIDIAKSTLADPIKKEKFNQFHSQKKWDDLVEFLSLEAVEFNLNQQKQDLARFGVHFDKFFSERHLHQTGEVHKTLEFLETKGVVFEEDGKKFFHSSEFDDDKDRVLVRNDGRPTYYLADIAYHKSKIDRGFQKIVDIWGPDHHGYIPRMKAGLKVMGYGDDQFEVKIAQQVNLIEEGKKVKMSKRLGKYQTMSDLLNYLGDSGKDVGRYFFLMRSQDSPLDFDLDLAKEQSDKNPVFYLQYAHARICSIFREVGQDLSAIDFENLASNPTRDRLIWILSRFPEEVADSAEACEPHRLINYLQSLAKAFTKFYMDPDNILKKKEGSEKSGLLFLLNTTRIALSEGLAILGISHPESM